MCRRFVSRQRADVAVVRVAARRSESGIFGTDGQFDPVDRQLDLRSQTANHVVQLQFVHIRTANTFLYQFDQLQLDRRPLVDAAGAQQRWIIKWEWYLIFWLEFVSEYQQIFYGPLPSCTYTNQIERVRFFTPIPNMLSVFDYLLLVTAVWKATVWPKRKIDVSFVIIIR